MPTDARIEAQFSAMIKKTENLINVKKVAIERQSKENVYNRNMHLEDRHTDYYEPSRSIVAPIPPIKDIRS